MMMLYADCCV